MADKISAEEAARIKKKQAADAAIAKKEEAVLKLKLEREKKKKAADAAERKDIAKKKKAEETHQKNMETNEKYAHDFKIASTKQWRETRIDNAAKEQTILDDKAKNDRKYSDVQEKNLADATKSRQKNEEDFATGIAESRAERSKAGELAEKLTKDKEGMSRTADDGSLGIQIKAMKSVFNDEEATANQAALLASFEGVRLKLDNPKLNDLERQTLELEMEQLKKGADAEEERREKQQVVEDQNNYFKQMSEGINRTADGFKSFRDGMVQGGGILAALGAVALIFFDPATLMAGITKGLEKVKEIVEIITGILSGDEGSWDKAFKFIEDNALLVGIAAVAAAVLLGGPVLAGFGAIAGGIGSIKTAAIASGNFVTGMVPGIKAAGASAAGIGTKAMGMLKTIGMGLKATALAAGGVMSTMFSSMLAFLAPFAIPIAIAVAIALVIAAIGYALTKLRDALGFDSVFDVILLGVAYVKDGLAHVANMFIGVYNKIMGLVGRFASWLGFEMPELEMEEMDTDNAVKFKKQAQEKKIQKDIERAKEEEAAAAKKLEPAATDIDFMSIDTMTPTESSPAVVGMAEMMPASAPMNITNVNSTNVQGASNPAARNADTMSVEVAQLEIAKRQLQLNSDSAQQTIAAINQSKNDSSTHITNVVNHVSEGVSRMVFSRRGFAPIR